MCRTVSDKSNDPQYSTRIKWDSFLHDDFRRCLISKLTDLNYIVNQIDLSDRNLINSCVDNFTRVINEVANPLFSKVFCIKRKNTSTMSDNKICQKAEWFDDECRMAKQLYLEALYIFNSHKSDESKINMHDLKSRYKLLVRRKKRSFEINKIHKIERLRHSQPREFWKLFIKRKNTGSDIPLQDFFEHFSKMQEDLNNVQNMENELFCQNNDFDSQDCNFEELDQLNAILNSGYFPNQWSEGIIFPLYKKNDPSDEQNYRGITLVSCFSKIFTGILNNRISNWAESNNILSDSQFGFRKGRSTTDAVFVLNAIIQKILNEKGRLFCAFVDLKRAFDSVYLNGLWFKLHNIGINAKMLRIIKDMYNKVKTCVRGCTSYSDFC